MMRIIDTNISGLHIVEVDPFVDKRGLFERLYCEKTLNSILGLKKVVQINHSITKKKGAIRGLHFQKPPFSEIKIIKCLKGKVYDVGVDIRAESPTFLQWFATELTSDNNKMVFLPEGIAHGFQTLEENTELIYMHTAFYTPEAEGGINVFDKKININWPLEVSEISDRDKQFKLIDDPFKGIDNL
jgi:dTDP-4-dehydrorhamnose 3,5-epimerase